MMSSLNGSSTSDEDGIMHRSRESRHLDIEAHPTELAIIIKYGPRKEQKM